MTQSRAFNFGKSCRKPLNVMGGVASDNNDNFFPDCIWDSEESRDAVQLCLESHEDDLLLQLDSDSEGELDEER